MARRADADARPPNVALGCLPNGEPADAFAELAVFECGAKYRAGRTRTHRHAVEGLAAGRECGFLVLAEAEHAAACRSAPLLLRRPPLLRMYCLCCRPCCRRRCGGCAACAAAVAAKTCSSSRSSWWG